MKFLLPFLFTLAIAALPLFAQVSGDDSDTPAPPGSTVITSNELHSDQANHVSVFTGNVIVNGTNFHMTCREMTVYFTNENKVDHLVATGDVIITQPNRVTHCGRADYQQLTDTFVLTDHPHILDGKNQVYGTQITIDRKTQKMTVDKGKSTVIIQDSNLGSSNTNAPSSTSPSDAK